MQWRRMRVYHLAEGGRYTLLSVQTAAIRVMWEVRRLMKEDVFTIRKCNRRIYTLCAPGGGKWYLRMTKILIVLVVSRKSPPIAYRGYRTFVGTGGKSAGYQFRGYLQRRRYRYAQFEPYRQMLSESGTG